MPEYEEYVDDTMPLPADVEREFMDKGTDQAGAIEWLGELGIDPAPILQTAGRIASFQWTGPWDPYAARYRFQIYDAEHIGPKAAWYIAVPIVEAGTFVDLLLIDMDYLGFTLVCGRVNWLGHEQLGHERVIRLHRDPVDWLEAGCRGICHVELISRQALKELDAAEEIHCNDIHTALEAWDWGFSSDDKELKRFVIDAHPENIRDYFNDQARWRAVHELQQTDLWPRRS